MLCAAVGHFYAFPYKEYAGANIGGSRGLTASLGHAVKLNDFYHDTVHQVSFMIYISYQWFLTLLASVCASGLSLSQTTKVHVKFFALF